ncbi:MAG: hypothetical protein SFU91_07555 [Chloroherpetonaceae bacterium]|nr:hypothetical protein [Chloroherpetonaceae bacterium]
MPEDLQTPPPLDPSSDPMGGMLPKKNRYGVLIFVSIISMLFMGVALRINWELERLPCESISPAMYQSLDRLPKGVNLIVFLSLHDIRKTVFWKEIIPDSIKDSRATLGEASLDSLAKSLDFVLLRDLDTLIYAAEAREGYEPDFLLLVSGRLPIEKLSLLLTGFSQKDTLQKTWSDPRITRLKPRLFAAITDEGRLLVSSKTRFAEEYLSGNKSFWESDTLLRPLVETARYKSQMWLVGGVAEWSLAALRGLTSSNQSLAETGNIAKIQKMVISMRFGDGVEGQTEWIYRNRTSAFFAGGLINIAIGVAKLFSSRTTPAQKELLERIVVKQNLEALAFDISLTNKLINDLQSQKEDITPLATETK